MFGERLRLARKKAGLSMRGLAAVVLPKVSAQAISKYERNEMMPSSSVLIGLAKALGVSLDFMMGSHVRELEAVEFRKHSGTSAKDRARAEALLIEALEDYLTVEDILEIEPNADPVIGVRYDEIQSFQDAEAAAAALRRAWKLGNNPIPSVTELLEDRGIKVVREDLPPRFDGLTCKIRRGENKPDAEAIVVSLHTTVERVRFNLAHELGHRVVLGCQAETVDYEKAMHRFAGAFLVPAEHLQEEFGDRRHGITYHEIIRLKRSYGISAAAMLIRLRDTGLLSPGVIEHAFRTYARRWRSEEPEPIREGEGFGAFERPSRYQNLVWRALGEKLISPSRAAQFLKCTVDRIEDEIRGPSIS